MEEKGVLLIGPSIGWIFAQGIYDLTKHEKFLQEVGASATELVMYLVEEKRQQALLNGDPMGMAFTTVHLDDLSPDRPSEGQVALAKKIVDRHKAAAAVAHPVNNPVSYYEDLLAAGVPAAIENMDRNKVRGHAIWELRDLIEKHGLKFVLDVQHAYEHDPGMTYAWELYQMGSPNLVYLHVSGQSEKSIHSLVHLAENGAAIIHFLGKVFSEKKLPIILEGQYTTAQEVKKEIESLKQELGF